MASKFQQRHYEAIAEVMQDTKDWRPTPVSVPAAYLEGYDDAVSFVVSQLVITFGNDNPLFDRGRFERACIPGANVKARIGSPATSERD